MASLPRRPVPDNDSDRRTKSSTSPIKPRAPIHLNPGPSTSTWKNPLAEGSSSSSSSTIGSAAGLPAKPISDVYVAYKRVSSWSPEKKDTKLPDMSRDKNRETERNRDESDGKRHSSSTSKPQSSGGRSPGEIVIHDRPRKRSRSPESRYHDHSSRRYRDEEFGRSEKYRYDDRSFGDRDRDRDRERYDNSRGGKGSHRDRYDDRSYKRDDDSRRRDFDTRSNSAYGSSSQSNWRPSDLYGRDTKYEKSTSRHRDESRQASSQGQRNARTRTNSPPRTKNGEERNSKSHSNGHQGWHDKNRSREKSKSPELEEGEEGEISTDEGESGQISSSAPVLTLSSPPRGPAAERFPSDMDWRPVSPVYQPLSPPLLPEQNYHDRNSPHSHSHSQPDYRPVKIKNRPTSRTFSSEHLMKSPDLAAIVKSRLESESEDTRPSTPPLLSSPTFLPPTSPPPPPPQPDDEPLPPPTPPAPPPEPENTPPPPPDTPDLHYRQSPPHQSSSQDQTQDQGEAKPANRSIETTKSQAKYDEHGDRADGKRSIPHAPNRNLLNPTTRVSTPIVAKAEQTAYAHTPKPFKRPTDSEELERLHRTFFGTTTLDAYDLGIKLGEGTFGVVTKGIETATKRAIALKKLITHNPRDGVSVTTVREIKILKSLNHPNIVEIIDMVVQRKNPSDRTERGEVFMVFPYMDHDLCGLLGNNDFKITHSLAKLFMKQILQGMDFIHANNFIHRDIKTANILVDNRGEIKIADFGLARTWTFDELMPKHMATEYTNMVVTRWYRAPELLLGDTKYGPAVDMWSLGCVLGEMYYRHPILQGESDRDQVFKILAHLGPLNSETWPGWKELPGFPEMNGYPWDTKQVDIPLLELAFKWGMDRGAADLMMKLLTLDPAKRLTADDALDHAWFWTDRKPATLQNNLITVDSSHEMTTRKKAEAPKQAARPTVTAQPPSHVQTHHRPPPAQPNWHAGQNGPGSLPVPAYGGPPPHQGTFGRPPMGGPNQFPPPPIQAFNPNMPPQSGFPIPHHPHSTAFRPTHNNANPYQNQHQPQYNQNSQQNQQNFNTHHPQNQYHHHQQQLHSSLPRPPDFPMRPHGVGAPNAPSGPKNVPPPPFNLKSGMTGSNPTNVRPPPFKLAAGNHGGQIGPGSGTSGYGGGHKRPGPGGMGGDEKRWRGENGHGHGHAYGYDQGQSRGRGGYDGALNYGDD